MAFPARSRKGGATRRFGRAAVSCLGHSDRAVIDADRAAARSPAVRSHLVLQQPSPMEALADALIDGAPQPRSTRCTSLPAVRRRGGRAQARAAILRRKGRSRQRVHLIARRQSYHGNSSARLAAGGNLSRRKQFEPAADSRRRTSRPAIRTATSSLARARFAYGARLAQQLEREIDRLAATG